MSTPRDGEDAGAPRRHWSDLFDGFRQDLAYAARSLRRTPAVSLTIILTLALGLGANAAMFSLLDVIFLRPPAGVAHPEALRRVWVERRFSNGTLFWPGYDYTTYAELARTFEGQADVTYYRSPTSRKLSRGEYAPTAAVAPAAASYFTVLGVKPAIGRFYTADEDRLDGAARVAVISHNFWERQFARAPSAIGQEVTFSGERFTIIGVTPPGFSGAELNETEVWIPVEAGLGPRGPSERPWWRNYNVNGFQVVLRLRSGAREGEMIHRATAVMRSSVLAVRRDSLAVGAFGSIIRARGPADLAAEMQVATRLGAVAIIVLLIACANVVNLLLARAMTRRREIAVRLALGVSRARLVRMLVTESVLLAVASTVAALVAASWGGKLLRGLLMPETHFAEPPLHWRVLAFGLAGAIIAGALAGLVPAVQSSAPDLTNALKAGGNDGGTHRSRLRSALVMCQAALSVVLLVGAVLFVRSLSNVKSHDVGYTVNRLAFASVSYDTKDSARDAGKAARLRGLQQRISTIPGVEGVAFASTRPKYSFSFTTYFPDIDTVGKSCRQASLAQCRQSTSK